MKKFFFLPSIMSWSLLILSVYIFTKLTFGQALLLLLPLLFVAFSFRKARVPFRETLKPGGEIYISPVHGTVESVRMNVPVHGENISGHEIRISISPLDEKGLYLPTNGEVAYLKANKGRKIPRNASSEEFFSPSWEEISHTDLVLLSKNQTKTLLRFVDSKFGIRPDIWLKSGDRGRGAACFGYYPFGGTVVLYLPRNCDVLVFENEHLTPGQSVIAAIKDI